jgi:anaerobic selenocysteine-containing dehydrogenase
MPTTRCTRGRAATASSRWAWPRSSSSSGPSTSTACTRSASAPTPISPWSAEVSLDTVATRTDLDRKTIEWLALEYFDRKPATILEGVGLQQYTRGHQTFQLIGALGVLSGNVGIPGGGVNLTNWPWREIRSPELLAEAARTAPARTLPVSQIAPALDRATDPPVTTALFMQTNFVNQMPDTGGHKAALARLDFVICLDQFMTDTAETAHLFLPITTFLEEEDLVPAYGHHWMQLMQPVAPPLGEARSDPLHSSGAGRSAGLRSRHGRVGGSWIDEAVKPLRGDGPRL